jgi:hypothetical protein
MDRVRKTLYIDIDSTIWPAEDEYTRAEMAAYGTDLLRTQYFTQEEMLANYGPGYEDVFKDALSPDRVHERELYPDCAEIICNLYHGINFQAYDIHFISHSFFASDIREPLREWLKSVMHVGVEFELTVKHERFIKANIMRKDPTAFALIDDRPKNVLLAKEAGYVTLCKRQVWNEGINVTMFDNWSEIPDLLYDLTNPDEHAMIMETL